MKVVEVIIDVYLTAASFRYLSLTTYSRVSNHTPSAPSSPAGTQPSIPSPASMVSANPTSLIQYASSLELPTCPQFAPKTYKTSSTSAAKRALQKHPSPLSLITATNPPPQSASRSTRRSASRGRLCSAERVNT